MLELEQIYRVERRRGIIALEGWDASGKSGAIQRLIEKLDPRWVHVWSISRPSPEEQGRHYLWRFWQRLKTAKTADFLSFCADLGDRNVQKPTETCGK